MNGFRPLRNDFVSASDQNIAKFTSKRIRCFGRKVHGKLRLRGRIRSSSQSIRSKEMPKSYIICSRGTRSRGSSILGAVSDQLLFPFRFQILFFSVVLKLSEQTLELKKSTHVFSQIRIPFSKKGETFMH